MRKGNGTKGKEMAGEVKEGKEERHMQRRGEVSGNKDMKGKDKVMRGEKSEQEKKKWDMKGNENTNM